MTWALIQYKDHIIKKGNSHYNIIMRLSYLHKGNFYTGENCIFILNQPHGDSEMILCMRPANERWRYNVTLSLIG